MTPRKPYITSLVRTEAVFLVRVTESFHSLDTQTQIAVSVRRSKVDVAVALNGR
jgi:hypothetical protein